MDIFGLFGDGYGDKEDDDNDYSIIYYVFGIRFI